MWVLSIFNVRFLSLNFYTFLSFLVWFFFFFFPESFTTLILSLVVFVFFKTISQAPPWGLARFLCISLLYVLLLCILPSWISAAWENPFSHLVPTYCLIFLCSKSLVNLLLAWILSQMLLIFAVPQWRKGVDNDKLPLTAVAGVVKLSGVISKQGVIQTFLFPRGQVSQHKEAATFPLPCSWPWQWQLHMYLQIDKNSNSAEGPKRNRIQESLVRWKEMCKLLPGLKGSHMFKGKLLEVKYSVSILNAFLVFVSVALNLSSIGKLG